MFRAQMKRCNNILAAHLHFEFSELSSNAQKCLGVMQTRRCCNKAFFFHSRTRKTEKIVSKARVLKFVRRFLKAKETITPEDPFYSVVHCLSQSNGLL